MNDRIGRLLDSAKRRVRWAWCASALSDLLPQMFLGLGAVGVVAWIVDRALPVWFFVVTPVVFVLAVIAVSVLQQLDDVDVARAVERRIGRDGVLISALEFVDPDDDWHREVQRRAVDVADDPESLRAIPIRFDGRRSGVAAVAVMMIAAVGVLAPIGGRDIASADRTRLIAEAEALDEVADVLADAAEETDDPDEADALAATADELRGLAEEIRSAESPLEAADTLEREAETLRDEAGADLLSDKAAVQGLEQQLNASPLTNGGQGGDAASQLDALADELDELSETERKKLADRLDALASSQTTGNQEVADALERAAGELRAGNVSSAGDALAAAANGQRAAVADLSARDVAASAANAATTAAGRLRDPSDASAGGQGDGKGEGDGEGDGKGEGDGNGSGQGDGNGSGQGDGNGSGQSQGNGSGQGQGQGQGKGSPGGGASGQVSGASPSGGQSKGQGGQGTPGAGEVTEGKTGVEQSAEVFDPVAAGESEEVDIDIAGGTGEGEVVGRSDAATSRGDSFVPYQDVLPTYLDSAAAALDELDLPPELRTTVRDYFDHIAER